MHQYIGYATEMPQMSRNGNKVYGCTFEIYHLNGDGDGDDGAKGTDLALGIQAKIKKESKIIDSKILNYHFSVNSNDASKRLSLEGDRIWLWGGKVIYVLFETEKEALQWKYSKIIKILEEVDNITNMALERNASRKMKIGLSELEDKYPELAL